MEKCNIFNEKDNVIKKELEFLNSLKNGDIDESECSPKQELILNLIKTIRNVIAEYIDLYESEGISGHLDYDKLILDLLSKDLEGESLKVVSDYIQLLGVLW